MARRLVCQKCGAKISPKTKRCPMCEVKIRKPVYKRWWFWLLILGLLGSCGKKDEEPTTINDGFGSNQEIIVTDKKEEDPDAMGSERVEEKEDTSEKIDNAPSIEEPLHIELVAGEQGEYGKSYTVNKGTEFEENYFVYHVPAGTYTVTNTGEYRGQFNVYSEELRVTEAGLEEPAETFGCLLLDMGEAGTIKIEEGQIIEIHNPNRFTLEETDDLVTEGEEKELATEEPESVDTPVAETPESTLPVVDMQTSVSAPEPPEVETPTEESEPVVNDDPSFIPVVVDPLSGDTVTPPENEFPSNQDNAQTENTYVINVNSGVYHHVWCASVSRMAEHNKSFYTGESSDISAAGYDPCKNCNP